MLRSRCVAPLAIFILLAFSAAAGQYDPEKESEFIDRQFLSAIGEIPKLAWLLPNGSVDAQERSPSLFLLSRSSSVDQVKLSAVLSPTAVELERLRHQVACDLPLSDAKTVLSVYTSPAPRGARDRQLLSTTKLMPGIAAGFEMVSLRGRAEIEVWKQMPP